MLLLLLTVFPSSVEEIMGSLTGFGKGLPALLNRDKTVKVTPSSGFLSLAHLSL
jgi:hypothetical protein